MGWRQRRKALSRFCVFNDRRRLLIAIATLSKDFVAGDWRQRQSI
jgi:hypothetical protein